ncbi:MAG: KilA-N domain-containing protein [Patescibacteria group bacterium]
MKKIVTKGIQIYILPKDQGDFISLTDIAKLKNKEFPAEVVKNWMRSRSAIEFLGLWEKINNPHFNLVEFDGFKNEAGSNSFVLSPQKWIETTHAIGLVSKSGRYGGGTFAHKDIAFEFASWISAEFKLFLIKEFQRLKEEENQRLVLGWDMKRTLAKINYKIHTDAIKEHLIPLQLSKQLINIIYATEADVLNMALFGKTAKTWRDANPSKDGNIRDYADVTQLVVLANLEGINAELIKQGISQSQRLMQLNQIAISQMQSLLGSPTIKKLKDRNTK